MQARCAVLLSGGIDSFSMIHFLNSFDRDIQALFVDYGQPAAQSERDACQAISKYFDVSLREITVTGLGIPKFGEIKARNLLLVSIAAASVDDGVGEIGIGIHSGTDYYDCGEVFFEDCKKIISDCSGQALSLIAPFLIWTKPQIIKYAMDEDLPIGITYSCERGTSPPCGSCLSCLDREGI